MVKVKKDVKSKGTVVGTIEYDEPANVAEATKMFGEPVVMELIKYALAVKEANKARSKLTGGGLPKDVQKALRADPKLLEQVMKEIEKRKGQQK